MATRTRETSAEWSATIPDHISAKDAVAKLQSALDYSADAVNAVMDQLGGGTLPPPRALLPALYDARDKVDQARGAIQSYADRTPEALVGAQYVTLGRQLGARLIDESNAAMDKAKQSESPATLALNLASAGARVAERAAGGAFKIAGKLLSPMEIAFMLLIGDELLNKGRGRKALIGK